jgi:CelD/BcsL family acetyltransferase involved in cellulose biosynthesis
MSDAQAVVHTPGFEWSPRELLRGCELDAWQFDHLIARQIPSVGRGVRSRDSWVMDVSGGYEAYISSRLQASRKIFKSTLYKARKLERDEGPTRFEFDATDTAALNTLLRWKSHQYRRTGRRDLFAKPWASELVHDLFESRSEGCTGTLSVLCTARGVMAAHFGLRADSTLSCWFPAFDPDFSRYSPGLILHLRMAEAATVYGLARLDLGKGDEEYKQSLKTGSVTVGEGWIRRPSIATAALAVRRTAPRLFIDPILRQPRLRHAARSALRRVGSIRERR